jgi:hypothetical protein
MSTSGESATSGIVRRRLRKYKLALDTDRQAMVNHVREPAIADG